MLPRFESLDQFNANVETLLYNQFWLWWNVANESCEMTNEHAEKNDSRKLIGEEHEVQLRSAKHKKNLQGNKNRKIKTCLACCAIVPH